MYWIKLHIFTHFSIKGTQTLRGPQEDIRMFVKKSEICCIQLKCFVICEIP